MGYLNNDEITIDAILTKKGRQKLASGQSLNITKFALGDDEIDYGLYQPAHPLGSAFYDAPILATPILEASPDETKTLRYRLVTLPKNTKRMPRVTLGVESIRITQNAAGVDISPSTSPSADTSAGYTLILADSSLGELTVTRGATQAGTLPVFLGEFDSATAQVVSGLAFRFRPNANLTKTRQSTLTVFGNETGGTATIPITVTMYYR